VDGVLDGVEQRWSTNTDGDGLINALDKDSDNDGVADGTEDTNRDGVRQANETNVLLRDTDYDGLQDGQETSGWKVRGWREITMNTIRAYKVTSDPNAVNNDGDLMNDTNESRSAGKVTGLERRRCADVNAVGGSE